MPRDASGNFSLAPVYLATPGTTIRAEQHNTPLQDIAQGITESLPRSGTAPMTGNLRMGGRRVTGVGAPTQAGDATTKQYVDNAVQNSATVTPERVQMSRDGIVGRPQTGSGTAQLVVLGNGIEFNGGFLRAAIGSGLTFAGALIAAVVSRFSTQAEATAGTNNDSAMTPLRTAQHVAQAQIQASQVQVPSQRLVGRPDGSAGSATGVALGAGLSFSGNSLVATVSRTATGDEARAGSDNSAAMTPLNTLQFANANLLGMFQAWVNVTGSRSVGTTYTNNTGKPIMVNVQAQGADLQVAVAGSGSWVTVGNFENNVDGRQRQSVVVPNGHVYRINGGSILNWSELR